MQVTPTDHFEVVVAAKADVDTGLVERVLNAAGYRLHVVTPDLHGLKAAAGVKPNAIVTVGLDEAIRGWILNFVEDNETPPSVVTIGSPDLLPEAPVWLYDIVSPDEIRNALAYRVALALTYSDMVRLTSERTQKLGLSRTQIRMLSMVDVVTGLFNRRYFEKHLAESFAAAKRYTRPLTCLVVRIDNFADLQADLGNERSNDVLDTIAEAFASVIRRADTAARIDDDLFGFLLPETPQAGADRLVERLQERFERAEYPHGADVKVSAAVVELAEAHSSDKALLDTALSGLPTL